MIYNKKSIAVLQKALDVLSRGHADLPPYAAPFSPKIEPILLEVAKKMQDNFPYHHPLYAGQMIKPPHDVARLAYMVAMWVNPNNHALDGGRASSAMEKDVVKQIAKMFGWSKSLGHLTSGGTFANLEALWIAGKIHPARAIVASELAHYTHERISSVLKLKFQKIRCTSSGHIDVARLESMLKKGNIGTVVVTMGTTGIGAVDPLDEILELQKKYSFRVHLDAAYGGYFKLAKNLSARAIRQYSLMDKVDSIVVDPHKHGLQPYGAGCILFKDASVGNYYKHDSPYTYFSSADLHLGEISLECSRAGASAVGVWATLKLLPLIRGGEFATSLERSHAAAMKLYGKINGHDSFISLMEPELDIIAWGARKKTVSQISQASKKIFNNAAKKNLHLALLNYPVRLLPPSWHSIDKDAQEVTLLRSCLMKSDHLDWVEEIWRIILAALV